MGDLDIDKMIILKFTSKKQNRRMWTGFTRFMISLVGLCEHGNEPMGSIKGEKCVAYLSNYLCLARILLY
jgi:hypothetical protein